MVYVALVMRSLTSTPNRWSVQFLTPTLRSHCNFPFCSRSNMPSPIESPSFCDEVEHRLQQLWAGFGVQTTSHQAVQLDGFASALVSCLAFTGLLTSQLSSQPTSELSACPLLACPLRNLRAQTIFKMNLLSVLFCPSPTPNWSSREGTCNFRTRRNG